MRSLAAVAFTLLASAAAYAQAQPQRSVGSALSPQSQAAPGTSTASPAALGIAPAKEADIRRLLEVTGAKSLMTEIMSSMEKNLKPMLTSSLPPGDYRGKLVDLFFEKFMTRVNVEIPKLLDAAVPVYDKYLSDDDIKGLIQFYQTPLGHKALGALPKITVEMQAQGQQVGEQIGRETMLQVLAEHPELAKALGDAHNSAAH
jgi:uncharacterized protein